MNGSEQDSDGKHSVTGLNQFCPDLQDETTGKVTCVFEEDMG